MTRKRSWVAGHGLSSFDEDIVLELLKKVSAISSRFDANQYKQSLQWINEIENPGRKRAMDYRNPAAPRSRRDYAADVGADMVGKIEKEILATRPSLRISFDG
eukprot:432535_1